jgi:cell division protein FtsL
MKGTQARNRVVRPDNPRQATPPRSAWPLRWWAWSLVLGLFVAAAALHVHSKLAVVQLGYALSQAARENRELLTEARELQVEVATLRSPRRLRKLAMEQMGLSERNPQQVIRLEQAVPRKLALGRPGR